MKTRNDSGVVGNLRGLASNGLRALRTRVELIGIEVELEKARITRQLVIAAATLYLISFGTLAAILWVALSLPEGLRGAVLGGTAIAFLAMGGGGLVWLIYGGAEAKPLLATTIAVLKSDEHALSGAKR